MRDDLRTPADEVHAHGHDHDTSAHEDVMRTAAKALRLCLTGDGAAGLALYGSFAAKAVIEDLRLGFDARLIDQAGFPATAAALRKLGLKRGADLAWQGTMRPGASAEMLAEEYERLFAEGLINARMIGRYIGVLTQLERTEAVAALFDFPRLLHRVTLGDAEAVARALDADADPAYRATLQIAHEMRHLGAIEKMGHPFDALLGHIHAEMVAYLQRFAASDHPLATLVPRDFAIEAWGMVSGADGHNVRHQHPVGWITGIYYPCGLPAGSVGGALRIGGWVDPPPPGWPELTIVPEPGLFVLIPSWYVHWSEPTQAEGLRMSIALDAVPG